MNGLASGRSTLERVEGEAREIAHANGPLPHSGVPEVRNQIQEVRNGVASGQSTPEQAEDRQGFELASVNGPLPEHDAPLVHTHNGIQNGTHSGIPNGGSSASEGRVDLEERFRARRQSLWELAAQLDGPGAPPGNQAASSMAEEDQGEAGMPVHTAGGGVPSADQADLRADVDLVPADAAVITQDQARLPTGGGSENAVAEKLLEGWVMLGEFCGTCFNPLMRSRCAKQVQLSSFLKGMREWTGTCREIAPLVKYFS